MEEKEQENLDNIQETSDQDLLLENDESNTSSVTNASDAADTTPPATEAISGVEIQATPESSAEEDSDEAEIQITDRLMIESKAYGKVVGRVYYTDDELIRVMPDGVSNLVYDFPIIDGEFDPDLGVNPDILFEKGPRTSFVDFLQFREGLIIDSYKKDGSFYKSYKILSVNVEEDSIFIEDKEKTEPEQKLEFSPNGIPRDLPFAVLRVAPQLEETPVSNEDEINESVESKTEEDEEDDEFETIGELELPILQEASKITASEQIVPDISQLQEFMSDLYSMLDTPSQRNPLYLSRIKAIAEMANALKHSIAKHGDSGLIIGQESPSIYSLEDLVKNRSVPLARPILTTKRIIEVDSFEGLEQSTKETDQLIINNLSHTLAKIEEYNKSFDSIPIGDTGSTPRFFTWLQGLMKKFPLGDKTIGANYQFESDSEYFRQEAPTTDTIEGLPSLRGKEIDELTDQYVQNVSQSLRRGLGPTTYRGPNGGSIVSIPADSANTKGYVLFPPTVNRNLGSKRTGNLAEDILRSHITPETMSQIIESLGGEIGELQDAGKILLLSAADTTIANIPFHIYLETILPLITPRGLGDIKTIFKDFGIDDKELNIEQASILQERINKVIISLRSYIRKTRTQSEQVPVTLNPLLDQEDNAFLKRLQEITGSIPSLSSALSEISKKTPGYKSVDIAIMAYLLTYYPDLTLAALGLSQKNLEREQERVTRNSFLETLRNAQKIQKLSQEKGAPPEENPCPHVENLLLIRKHKNDSERMALMAKFVTRFQPTRVENWWECISCSKHLVCHHEFLQIQQFLHPREFDVLQKDIVLHFAGGRYGGNYICRNCGLPISALEYDTNIEFDDEGRPMMGRSAIVDEDEAEEEELMQQLSAPVDTTGDLEFNDSDEKIIETKKTLYQIAKKICDRIGVFLDKEGFIDVVEMTNQRLSMQPSAKRYAELTSRTRSAPDYNTHISRLSISLVSCLILTNIQSHIPDYVVRYVLPGCQAGFDGYPLKSGAEPMTSTGIKYLACALNGITEMSGVWGQTGWQTIRSDKDREETILKQLATTMKIIVDGYPNIQINLEKKRNYLKDIYGKMADSDGAAEKIPFGFLPRIETASEATEESAKEPTISTGIRGEQGELAISQAWIRAANKLANETARKIQGTPFAETACCFENHTKPQEFLSANGKSSSSLPTLPRKKTILRPTARATWTFVPFTPTPLESAKAEQKSSIIYRIFMSICYKGEREGLAHEFSYDNQCDWCGIKIPIEYIYPDVDKYGNVLYNDELLTNSFNEQGIPISIDSFERLLDISHSKQTFKSYYAPMPPAPEKFLENMQALEVTPIENWSQRILQLLAELQKLPPSATDAEIALAFSPLTEKLNEAEEFCKQEIQKFEAGSRMSTRDRKGWDRLSEIVNSENVYEIVRACIVIPCARVLRKFNRKILESVKPFYNLSSDHKDDIASFMSKHTKPMSIIEGTPLDEFALAKLEIFVDRVAEFLKNSAELKSNRLPYGKALLPYLNRIAIMGPLAELLDSNKIPETFSSSDINSINSKLNVLIRFILNLLDQYSRERLAYSTEEIRNSLAREIEKEKNDILKYFDAMSEEEKRVELVKKKLGIGRWSIGGTKLIWAYNQEQYDKERADNLANYEMDAGPNGIAQDGRDIGNDGFWDYGADYDNVNNGYDAQDESPDDL